YYPSTRMRTGSRASTTCNMAYMPPAKGGWQLKTALMLFRWRRFRHFSSSAASALRSCPVTGNPSLIYLRKRFSTMKRLLTICLLGCVFARAQAQLLKGRDAFGLADSLRGQLTDLRTCYDINYYHLDVRVDPHEQTISGSNLFRFTATADFT